MLKTTSRLLSRNRDRSGTAFEKKKHLESKNTPLTKIRSSRTRCEGPANCRTSDKSQSSRTISETIPRRDKPVEKFSMVFPSVLSFSLSFSLLFSLFAPFRHCSGRTNAHTDIVRIQHLKPLRLTRKAVYGPKKKIETQRFSFSQAGKESSRQAFFSTFIFSSQFQPPLPIFELLLVHESVHEPVRGAFHKRNHENITKSTSSTLEKHNLTCSFVLCMFRIFTPIFTPISLLFSFFELLSHRIPL